MKKINAIVEARMGSSRLRGKTMFEILDKPVLQLLLERLRLSKRIDQIVVACPTNPEDDVIEKFCREHAIECFRGSSEDVVSRVYHAAEQYQTDIVVEVTGDCPLLDPYLIDECLDIFEQEGCDYLSNFIEQSYPPGVDVQIFTFDALKRVYEQTTDSKFREHVTLYILKNPQLFTMHNVKAPKEFYYPDWHIELDEAKDYELIKKIYESLYPVSNTFTTMDVINLLLKNKDWLLINQDVNRTWEQARKEETADGTC